MCGIIGYTGIKAAAPILLEGLSKLEYRGYDSSGIAVVNVNGDTTVCKSQGKLAALIDTLSGQIPEGHTGIGHTRWATHGGPTDDNAHPHIDCRNEVAVVHNGIVENFVELRAELQADGHCFSSDTDSECISHLIESYIDQDMSLQEATLRVAGRIHGAQAVVVTSKREPGKLIAFRQGNAGGIVIGYGDQEMFVASDLPALLQHTRKVAYLAGGEAVVVMPGTADYLSLDGVSIKKRVTEVSNDATTTAKGEYPHFMLKEIHDQPEAVISSIRGRVSFDKHMITLDEFSLNDDQIKRLKRVVLIGMGTSMHAAMVGRYWIESLARIPAEADNSSEFRYRDPVIDDDTLVVSVGQSGETADTLAGMTQAALRGSAQVTLCNYEGTQATRIADDTLLIRAGLEIAVAGTKTFSCSLVSLYLLALHLGVTRGVLDALTMSEIIDELSHLPHLLGTMLSNEDDYSMLAQKYGGYDDFLYLGRGIEFPLAMEGALKLKEISYIHAEGYPAGEMKHGPISLIDENMPIVALIPKDELYEKMMSNINEVKARGGKVIAVATEGDSNVADIADDVIFIPGASSKITPVLMAVPMQLLAYHIAIRRGVDVDQPRNLAKSVTVE